jgi:hypothetical protein
MTTLRNIAMTIGLTAILGSATLFAQSVSTADIPFDFQITGKTLPAGQYNVHLSDGRQMLVFQNTATGRSTLALAYAYKSGMPETPVLKFRQNGDRYTLESAWFAGVTGGFSPLGGKPDRANGERGIVATVRLLQK